MAITRREAILSAVFAGATFGAPKSVALLTPAQAEAATAAGFYKFNVGDIAVTTVLDGVWEKPHDPGFITNATVDQTKAALKAGGLDDSKVVIPFTVTFVKIAGKTIMFDSGTGGQLSPNAGKLLENMGAAGIDRKSISTIIVTHFHPDHIFGLMEKETNAPVYPDVEIIVPAAEMKFWNDPAIFTTLPKGSHDLATRIQATLAVWKNVRQIESDAEAVPGIRAVQAFGHTPGHTAFQLSSGKDQLMVLADLTNIPVLFAKHPDWHASFDSDPKAAETSRRKLFDRVVADRAVITGYHYGMPGAGVIEKDGNGYAFVPVT